MFLNRLLVKGAVVLSAVHQRRLSLVRDMSGAADNNQQVVDPHAHVFEWHEQGTGSSVGDGVGVLLKHVGFVGALGYICSARAQRRFVVLSPQRRFAVVAEGKLVTVFATASGPKPPQQICEVDPSIGEMVGLTIIEPEQSGGGGGSSDACQQCAPVTTVGGFAVSCACGPPKKSVGVLLVLGTAGVSAVQLLAAPAAPAEPTAEELAVEAEATGAAGESEDMKALRLRALEMLSGDGEW